MQGARRKGPERIHAAAIGNARCIHAASIGNASAATRPERIHAAAIGNARCAATRHERITRQRLVMQGAQRHARKDTAAAIHAVVGNARCAVTRPARIHAAAIGNARCAATP